MRVLFVLGKYYPYAGANGVCVSRIQEVLFSKGIYSDVVAESEDTEADSITAFPYGKIYYAELKTADRLSRFHKIVAALRYPVYFPENIAIYEETINKALKENRYSAIIAVLKPLDGAIASARFSNLLIYELDSVTNNDDAQHGFRKYLRHRGILAERSLYKKASFIFHMISHEKYYGQKRYDRFREKSVFLDVPQLVDEHLLDTGGADDERKTILYSGLLNRKMRSPEYFISLIREWTKDNNKGIEVDFYSRGDCEGVLEEAAKATNGVIRKHGYVTLDELNKAVSKSDFLLSIGNSLTGQVTSLPSKVISYMAYGKPIIHIDGGENDVAKQYLEKYPLSLIITPTTEMKTNIERLQAFVEEQYGKRVPFEEVRRTFIKNTPEYSAEIIEQKISETCNGIVERL